MPVEVAAAQKLLFDIPQSSANVALREYAIQADRQILIPHEVVKEYNANSVAGYYYADDALDILLEDSGLEAVTNEAGILIIKENKIQVRGEETVMTKPKKGLLAALLGVFGAGTAAMAPGVATAQEGVSALDEIIVTAQKREQNLQDVGISITAFDAKALARAGIDDVSRVFAVTPGMNYGYYGSDAKIAIRGAHSNNTYGDNQSVAGFYIDGVYRARPSQQSQGYFDVERIEVLKGPQGTLYGRNTFAGAINLYTKKPSTEGMTYGIEAGVADYGYYSFDGHVNLPVGDNLALRVAFATKDSDGYIDNQGAGDDIGGQEQRNVRVSALWSPNEDLDVLARYTRIENGGSLPGVFASETICKPVNANGITDGLGPFEDCTNDPNVGIDNVVAFQTPYLIETDQPFVRDYLEENVTLDINWDFTESLNAHAIFSYTDFTNHSDGDGDVSSGGAGCCYSFYLDEAMESTTWELNVTYAGDGPISGTAGVYYSEDTYQNGYSEEQFGVRTFAAPGSAVYAELQTIGIDTEAVFVQLEFAATDSLRLIGGVRYNDEVKQSSDGADFFFDFDPSFVHFPARPLSYAPYTDNPASRIELSFDIVTWRVGTEWDFSDDAMFYANIATGYLSGGVNLGGTLFDEQENKAYELGIKSRWADDTVQLNAAVYKNEGTDLTTQLGVIDPNGVFITTTVNGGVVWTYGAEAELTWLPTDQWRLAAGLSIMNSEHRTFFIDKGFTEFGGSDLAATGGLVDLRGTAPPWAPDATLSLSASYDYDLGGMGTLTPFLQVYYSSDYNTDDLVTYAGQRQEDYSKTDFRLFWSSADGRFGAEAFVENIEDIEVLGRTNRSFQNVETSYLHPRNYGVKFSYNYE